MSRMLAAALLVLALVAPCLAATPAPEKAAAESARASPNEIETRYYTVTLPSDWRVISAPAENQGITTAVFAKTRGITMVSLLAADNNGESARTIAELFAEQFRASRTPTERNGQYTFNFSSQNMQRQAWIACDGDSFMLVTIYGNRTEALNFIRRHVSSRDYPGLLPQ